MNSFMRILCLGVALLVAIFSTGVSGARLKCCEEKEVCAGGSPNKNGNNCDLVCLSWATSCQGHGGRKLASFEAARKLTGCRCKTWDCAGDSQHGPGKNCECVQYVGCGAGEGR